MRVETERKTSDNPVGTEKGFATSGRARSLPFCVIKLAFREAARPTLGAFTLWLGELTGYGQGRPIVAAAESKFGVGP
jgi:hypothetical protein